MYNCEIVLWVLRDIMCLCVKFVLCVDVSRFPGCGVGLACVFRWKGFIFIP